MDIRKTTVGGKTPIELDISDSIETTEEYSMEEGPIINEELAREEMQRWLDLHGKALFSLEASKFLAKERRLQGNLVNSRK